MASKNLTDVSRLQLSLYYVVSTKNIFDIYTRACFFFHIKVISEIAKLLLLLAIIITSYYYYQLLLLLAITLTKLQQRCVVSTKRSYLTTSNKLLTQSQIFLRKIFSRLTMTALNISVNYSQTKYYIDTLIRFLLKTAANFFCFNNHNRNIEKYKSIKETCTNLHFNNVIVTEGSPFQVDQLIQ